MPFAVEDDRWRILIALELPQSEGSNIEQKLRDAQSRSAKLVDRILEILGKLEQADQEINTASLEDAGLTKIGEIEYNGDRICTMNHFKRRLQYQLADLLSYTLPPLNYW